MNWQLTSLQERHLTQVVHVHMQAFPGFFLTFLGPRFLKEFYASFLADPAGVGFVAEASSGEVLGVVVGPLVPDGYYRRLLVRRWWAFAAASFGAVVRKPTTTGRLVRAVFYRGASPADQRRSLLSSLTVAPAQQGKGIGRALVRRWLEEVRMRGAQGCYLTTDAEGNEGVNHFYQSLGWIVDASYRTPEGRRMNRYILDFPGEPIQGDVGWPSVASTSLPRCSVS